MLRAKHVIAAVVVWGVGSVCWAQLADAPWPTFHHDVQRTGRSPYVGPAEPVEKWRFQMDSVSIASIAIGGDGTVYAGDQSGIIYAVNPDGTEKWRFQTLGERIWSSGPTVGIDGTIYTGSITSSGSWNGRLYALNPDGSEKWRFLVSDHIYGAPAIAADGTIYFGCRDERLYALNPAGEELWSFRTQNRGYFASSPTIGHDGSIYAPTYAGDYHLYRLDPGGDQVWRTRIGESYGGSSIDANGVIYTATTSGDLVATNPDGTLKWEIVIGGSFSVPCIGWDGTIYATGGYDGLHAVSPEGEVLWTAGVASSESPIVDREGTVYVANLAFRPDGSFKWVFRDGQFGRTRPAMDSDGTYYVAGSQGWLYAIGPGRGGPPFAADAVDLNVIAGSPVSGGLGDLVESDDVVLVTRSAPGFRVIEPNLLMLDIGFDTDIVAPTGLSVTVESRIDHPSGTATISLRNWSSGAFDRISTYPIGRDEEVVDVNDIEAGDYVRPSDGRVEVRIKHVVIDVFRASGFRSFFDQVRVLVE